MSRTGRTTKLTAGLQTMITNAVMLGVPAVTAAQYAGASKAALCEWVARGEGRHQRASSKLYVDFVDALTRAKAQDETRRLARLEQAARGRAVTYRKTTTYVDAVW